MNILKAFCVQCPSLSINLQASGLVAYHTSKQTSTTTSSTIAEKETFVELLDKAKVDLGGRLYSITTDGSISIRAHMKKNEPAIRHGLDVWHLSKNVIKNLNKKCRRKVCQVGELAINFLPHLNESLYIIIVI